MEYFKKIKNAIEAAEKEGLKTETEGLTGYSGEKMIGCLQRLAQIGCNENKCYLEIGVYQGMTLLSVGNAVDEKINVYGIDNFAFFDKEGKNYGIVKARRDKLQLDNVKVINLDYEDALHALKSFIGEQKIGLFFIDGPHDYRSQMVCLLFAKPYLAADAIIVVDDCNYRHVRQANADFLIGHQDYKLFFEAYTKCHPQNMTSAQISEAREGWWDGINIIVRDEMNLLKNDLPATERSRTWYENEHQVHASRFPESALNGGYLAEAYYHKNWVKILKQNYAFFKQFTKKKGLKNPAYSFSNTYSSELPKRKFNGGMI